MPNVPEFEFAELEAFTTIFPVTFDVEPIIFPVTSPILTTPLFTYIPVNDPGTAELTLVLDQLKLVMVLPCTLFADAVALKFKSSPLNVLATAPETVHAVPVPDAFPPPIILLEIVN